MLDNENSGLKNGNTPILSVGKKITVNLGDLLSPYRKVCHSHIFFFPLMILFLSFFF